jgi:hypothetical protein
MSDVHVGGIRYSQELLHAAIREINEAEPDVVVVDGDLQRSLGEYPRDWPDELVGRRHDPFVRAPRGEPLANDQPPQLARATGGREKE